MKRLVSSDEAITADRQHTKPCSDCPWSRKSLNGWLGGASAQDWISCAHSDQVVNCHTISNQQCAGLAIYRRNVAKFAYPPALRLEADRVSVFALPHEFIEHHSRLPEPSHD